MIDIIPNNETKYLHEFFYSCKLISISEQIVKLLLVKIGV